MIFFHLNIQAHKPVEDWKDKFLIFNCYMIIKISISPYKKGSELRYVLGLKASKKQGKNTRNCNSDIFLTTKL